MRSKPNAQPNQSLIDGIATLQALAISPEPIGGRELARRLGFESTRVNRLLKTLAYLGIARQTANRKYTAGAGMHVLAAQSLFASGLIQHSLPMLENLRRFGHTVALGVLWRDNVTYLFHAPPGTPASQAVGRVGLYPATTSGIGMALLATLDDKEISDIYLDREIPGFPGGLKQMLDSVGETRSQGFANIEVHEGGDHRTIAIAIGQPTHSAIGLSGWIPQSGVAAVVDALKEAAHGIETEGNERPSPAAIQGMNALSTTV
jgi:DNA-binding IclR family transcriptional regulator